MPVHLHGVLCITDPDFAPVAVGARHASPLHRSPRHALPGTLGTIVGAFKSASTRLVNAAYGTPGALLWQRNYYEHIVRSEADLDRIRRYIAKNPAHWTDRLAPA